MIWDTVSSQSLSLFFFFFADYVELLHFSCKEYNQFDFDINHQVISICRVISCVVGRGHLLWPVHSLGKTVLAFDLLHFVLQGQTYLIDMQSTSCEMTEAMNKASGGDVIPAELFQILKDDAIKVPHSICQ